MKDLILEEDAEATQGLVRNHFVPADSISSTSTPTPVSPTEVTIHHSSGNRSYRSPSRSTRSSHPTAPSATSPPVVPTPRRNTRYNFTASPGRDSEAEDLYDDLFEEEEELDESRLRGGEEAEEDEEDFHQEERALRSCSAWTNRPSIFRSGVRRSHSPRTRNNRRNPQTPSRRRSQPEFQRSRTNGSIDSGDSASTTSSTETTSMSLALSDRNHDPNHTASLLDSMERRTQRTYRYGIGLVCVGATLNWLGFAQGHGYVDPLRYLGVACVITGSFCVCLAMCRWLGRPISVSSHRVSGLSRLDYQNEQRVIHPNGDVHVINVSVPMYVPPNMHEEYRPTKPPDYEIAVAGEPPPYDEAIKLDPSALFGPSTPLNDHHAQDGDNPSYFSCGHPSPSHSTTFAVLPSNDPSSEASPLPLMVTSAPDSTLVSGGNTTMTISLSENIRNAAPSFQDSGGHSTVVVVDASESANPHHQTNSLGAPPPYTKEYTPSPRRSVPPSVMSTPEHSSSSLVLPRSGASAYLIVPTHSGSVSSNHSSSNLYNNNVIPEHRSVFVGTNSSVLDNAASIASETSLIANSNVNLNSNANLNNNVDGPANSNPSYIVIHP